MVLLGGSFLAIWLLALFFLNGLGRGVHLLLLIPIVAFAARALEEELRRDAIRDAPR
jgi:hypothetical protein